MEGRKIKKEWKGKKGKNTERMREETRKNKERKEVKIDIWWKKKSVTTFRSDIAPTKKNVYFIDEEQNQHWTTQSAPQFLRLEKNFT
jgi:hypothetical protein